MNMHVSNDAEEQQFATWLCDLAKGKFNDADDNIVILDEFLCIPNSIEGLIQHFHVRIEHRQHPSFFHDWCILCPRNKQV
jgi:hypothetical protein